MYTYPQDISEAVMDELIHIISEYSKTKTIKIEQDDKKL